MALTTSSPTRQNIRIEIKNDFTENMEEDIVDNNELSEGEVEDGEISDSKTPDGPQQTKNKLVMRRNVSTSQTENQWANGERGFTTGIDIFTQEEQEKLQNRAQRFGLDPSERKAMTDDLLQELYDSLGLTNVDQNDTRFDTIHMYGTQDMTTQDIFDYFGKYGPASIEWINDISCNVVWHDKISVARAFIALSKPIRGMPVNENTVKLPDDEKKFHKGRSILLVDENMEQEKENNSQDGLIHVSEIDIRVPAGFWRLGDPHEKSKNILLRFAKRTDAKPYRAERFGEYTKKFSNNFNSMPGLISASRKRKLIDNNYKDLDRPEPEVKGNPWGSLARNWDRDIQETVIPPRVQEPVKISLKTGPISKSLLTRIGDVPQSDSEPEEESEEKEEKPKKSKVPRMKMYADEEEAKIRRRIELRQIKKLEEIEQKMTQVPDLRSRLGRREKNEERRRLELPKPPPKPQIQIPEKSSSSEYSDEELNVQQRSKVAVVVRKPSNHKPTVASTVWSRLDQERRNRIQIKREIPETEKRHQSESSSESSESDDEYSHRYKRTLSKTVNERPGFKTADLKSRLGFQASDHKSPLRIEISNDHYKKEKP